MACSGRQAFFRLIRNTKNLKGARRMVQYVAFRARELAHEAKGGFDREHDHANVDRFCQDLDHRLTRHPKVPVAFHGLLSFPREEVERAGLTDWRAFVREVMSQYEAERQIRLEWFGAFHDSKTHPHCHVIIKAVSTNLDGRETRLRFNREDLKLLRRIAGRTLARHRALHQAQEQRRQLGSLARARTQVGRLMAVGGVLNWLQEQLRRERQRRYEEERKHQRWLREQDEHER